MLYQSVVTSILSYAVVRSGGSTTKADLSRFEKLVRWAVSVVRMKLDPLVTVAERRTLNKLQGIWTTPTTICTPSSAARGAGSAKGCPFQRAGQTD